MHVNKSIYGEDRSFVARRRNLIVEHLRTCVYISSDITWSRNAMGLGRKRGVEVGGNE